MSKFAKFSIFCLDDLTLTISFQYMLVDEVGIEDTGACVEGWRGCDYDVLTFFVLKDEAQQSHYKVTIRICSTYYNGCDIREEMGL